MGPTWPSKQEKCDRGLVDLRGLSPAYELHCVNKPRVKRERLSEENQIEEAVVVGRLECVAWLRTMCLQLTQKDTRAATIVFVKRILSKGNILI